MVVIVVPVRVVSAPKVTLSLYVCVPLVLMLLAKVLVPVTVKLELTTGPELLLVMDGVVPLMLSEPTVNAICKSSVALLDPVVLLIVNAFVVAPKLLVLSTFKVPKLMVVPLV